MKGRAFVAAIGLLAAGCNLGGSLNVEEPDPDWVDPNDPDNMDDTRDPDDPVDEDDLPDLVEEKEIDVARVTIHRLNRAEYNNTVRDLLGDTTAPADNFPDDDFGYGFNNIADVLSVSPLHVEMYAQTAEALIAEAVGGGPVNSEIARYEAEVVGSTVGAESGDTWNLYSNGSIETVHNFAVDGEYTFRVSMRQQQAGPDDAISNIVLNGVSLSTVTVVQTALTVFEVTADVTAGAHSVGVTFENDYYDPDIPADRNLYVDWFEVEGPLNAMGEPSEQRAQILTCEDDTPACTAEIISAFGLRAWRRPLTDEEVTRLGQFVDLAKAESLGWEDGIKLALEAMLVSPNFIYRVETDPDLDDPAPHPLTDYEMASRMSYFLWSTMPDQELFDLAAAGSLQDEAVLRAQVTRMLDDPRASALVDNFATQWLFIDVINDVDPDYTLYADFDEDLRQAMRAETRLFFENLLSANAPIKDLLLADYSFVNDRLASHYGLTAPGSTDLTRTSLPANRRGLLGHGGLLTSLSFPTRTSPVKRGAWVLGNMLCSEPPPPPPGVENLPVETAEPGTTLREQMEAHSTDPACSGCHSLMDPIGFGMEDFDAIGGFRDMDNGSPLDSSGTLPDGSNFDGAVELAGILAEDPKYAECVAEKLLTYGLGRGLEPYDDPQLELLLEEAGEDFGFRDLITEVVLSPAFRMRRGGELPD